MVTVKIKPSDINVENGFMASIFQNAETEASMYFLVKMAQQNGSWRNFTKAEIDNVAGEDFWWNYLKRHPFNHQPNEDKDDYILYVTKDGMHMEYEFTDKFINECYRLSPKKKK